MNNNYKLRDIETDITLNSNIKDSFFNQLKNNDYKYDFIDNDIIIRANLCLPNDSDYPFEFIIDTEKYVIIPQYTQTRRAYIPNKKEELEIIKNTVSSIKNKIAHPRKVFNNNTIDVPKNKFVGKFSGIKSRDDNNFILSYDLPKSFHDLDSSIFLDSSENSFIKNIFIYNNKKDKENLVFIKLFNPEQYRILINPEYEDLLDVDISFTDTNINLKLILSDSIDTDSISLICKG